MASIVGLCKSMNNFETFNRNSVYYTTIATRTYKYRDRGMGLSTKDDRKDSAVVALEERFDCSLYHGNRS